MREFFKGWRRKLGCGLLLLASALLAAWIRTCFVTDEFNITDYGTTRIIKSAGGHVAYEIGHHNGMTRYWGYFTHPKEEMSLAPIIREEERMRYTVLGVAYWLLMIPPSLGAAYLILWKPRKQGSGPTQN